MISRRRLLVGAGGLSATGLWGLPRLTRADESIPTRVILFYTPHGTVWDDWRPTGTATNFTLGPILGPLTAFQDRIALVDGLQIRSPYAHRVPHTYDLPALWTGSPIDTESELFERTDHEVTFGWNTGTSVDQFIANALPTTTPHRTLEFGVGTGNGLHPARRMIYSGPAAPHDPFDGAHIAWNTLFSDVSPGTTSTGGLATQRASILDQITRELSNVRSTVSPTDRVRLDAHTEAIRELELTLTADVVCTPPPVPPVSDFSQQMDNQIDVMVAALACGLTNVASFQHRIGDNDTSLYQWLGITTGGHHLTSHDTGPEAQALLSGLYTYYAERFQYLLQKLDSLPEGSGTMLDHTLVIWGSEVGVGWSHDVSNIPFVVAGGSQTGLIGHRYHDLRGSNYGHNRLLVSACHAMGLSKVTSYGSTDEGSGGVPGLLL